METIDRAFFKQIIEKRVDDYFHGEGAPNGPTETLKYMYNNSTQNYKYFNPFVNGYYYIHMVSGTWIDSESAIKNRSKTDIQKFKRDSGFFATDINIPQLSIEYESASTKNRSLNYATRLNFAGDFDVNYIESQDADVFKYHETWFKYIEEAKKGFFKFGEGNEHSKKTINMPYLNAIWICIFHPLTQEILGLVKLMGVSPIGLPFKEILGDRSKPALAPITQAYKCNDIFYKLYDKGKWETGSFEQNFLNDVGQESQGSSTHLSSPVDKLYTSTNQEIKTDVNLLNNLRQLGSMQSDASNLYSPSNVQSLESFTKGITTASNELAQNASTLDGVQYNPIIDNSTLQSNVAAYAVYTGLRNTGFNAAESNIMTNNIVQADENGIDTTQWETNYISV